jgi:hypothetical protein
MRIVPQKTSFAEKGVTLHTQEDFHRQALKSRCFESSFETENIDVYGDAAIGFFTGVVLMDPACSFTDCSTRPARCYPAELAPTVRDAIPKTRDLVNAELETLLVVWSDRCWRHRNRKPRP